MSDELFTAAPKMLETLRWIEKFARHQIHFKGSDGKGWREVLTRAREATQNLPDATSLYLNAANDRPTPPITDPSWPDFSEDIPEC